LRGSLTLFADIFETPAPKLVKKGRSSQLHDKRNECLVDRYYFYANFSDKRYSAIIEILSVEFFLSTVTIPELLQANQAQIRALKKQNPGKVWFKGKWPHLTW
jgi:hypothetical protein